jgi:hypothetical protein
LRWYWFGQQRKCSRSEAAAAVVADVVAAVVRVEVALGRQAVALGPVVECRAAVHRGQT